MPCQTPEITWKLTGNWPGTSLERDPCRVSGLKLMPIDPQQTVYYKKSRFTSRLPIQWKYSPSHYWLREVEPAVWQVGLTKFATRMLGDLVEHNFEVQPGSKVAVGQIIGSLEGFKAITDVFCVVEGVFSGGNRALESDLTLMDTDPYDAGWLYAMRGAPDQSIMDVHGYMALLDATIEKMVQQQRQEDPACRKPGT